MRNHKQLVYGSSYDRGLQHLLEMWQDIIKEVPDAKLTIFYGWDLFVRVLGNNPASMAWKEKMEKLMSQPGITHLGRISHEAVKVEFEKAGIWAYPTHFGEISCITAMKAQAYGAVPVVTDWAALKETVQYGIKVEGDIYEPEVKEEYKKQLIALLQDSDRQEEMRVPMMRWARETFGWNKVAEQWDQEFKTPPSLEKQVESRMDDNQPLKAWDLVKDTDSPLKEKVFAKVRHAFDEKEYKKFYGEELVELPVPENFMTQAENVYPRWHWFFESIKNKSVKTMIDLGCADGVLPLTCAKNGIKSVGVNLYKPSVDLANKRAKELGFNATFIHGDLFDQTGKYDAVVLMEVLEHLPYPKKGIDHAMSLVADGGSLYLSTPRVDHLGVELHKKETQRNSWDDGKPSGHLRLFTEQELADLLSEYKIVQFQIDPERCMVVEVQHK